MKTLCELCEYYNPKKECNISKKNCSITQAFQQLMWNEFMDNVEKLVGLGEGE